MLNLKIDNVMDYKKIAESIDKDIENGVYDKFPNLRDRLKFISKKSLSYLLFPMLLLLVVEKLIL